MYFLSHERFGFRLSFHCKYQFGQTCHYLFKKQLIICSHDDEYIYTWMQVDVQTFVDSVHIYSANPQIQPRETCNVADRIKKGLSKTLVHYDIFAGRLRVNEESNRLELHRNYAGVPFSTASCHAHTLEDLGDLSTPKPFFRFCVCARLAYT